MERLKAALEDLDEAISVLEDKVGVDKDIRRTNQRRMNEMIKTSRVREANALAVTQKVAARLDHAIERVELLLRDE